MPPPIRCSVLSPILPEAGWDKILDTNLKGPFLLCQAAANDMAPRGAGAIVNIASTGGLEPSPMLGAYCVSKAAIIMLTKTLASELGPRGIRVNCIAPGLVETKFADVLVNTPSIHDAIIERSALRRHGQPEEIAGAAHYPGEFRSLLHDGPSHGDRRRHSLLTASSHRRAGNESGLR